MHFFADDYRAFSKKGCKSPDVFCYGGFIIEKTQLKELENFLNQIKLNYNIPIHLPLRWNLKDTRLKYVYKQHGQEKLLSDITSNSVQIRKEVFEGLAEFNAKVIFSGFRELRIRERKKDLLEWAFTNILQRIPFELSDAERVLYITLDWDAEFRNVFFECFESAYYHGVGKSGEEFYEDCIRRIKRGIPYISFSVTNCNPFLQIADMIVGACGSFLEYVFKDSEPYLVKITFPIVARLIRGYGTDNMFQWGLLIKPRNDQEKVKEKFRALLE